MLKYSRLFENESYLKEIFNGMKKKLSEIQKDSKFDEEFKKKKSQKFGRINNHEMSDNEFFECMCRCIFTAGFRNIPDEEWKKIKKEFRDFDIDAVTEMSKWTLDEIFKNFKTIKNFVKIIACIRNASKIKEIAKKHNSFYNYLKSFGDVENDTSVLLKLVEELREKFDYIGGAVVYDFLKDVGFECVKPDRHVIRILKRLKLLENKVNEEHPKEKDIEKIQDIGKKIARLNNCPVKVVDLLFWLYGSGFKDIVDKAICGEKPNCNECYIKNCPRGK
jgi:3-methyladenine DNA glycosylase Tag